MGWTSYFYVAAALAAVAPVSAQGVGGGGTTGAPAGGAPGTPPAGVGFGGGGNVPRKSVPGGGTMGAPGGLSSAPSAASAADPEVERLRVVAARLERLWKELTKEYQEALTQFGPDHPTVLARRQALQVADAEMARTQESLNARLNALASGIPKSRVLRQPVAVEWKNATVRQAAEALSKATAMQIEIAREVPDDLRLTVQARGVSFGAVLQAIAKQANLKISPSENGILLTPWPRVEVNGQLQVFKGAWAPWGTEWGVLPGYQTSDGWDFPGEAEAFRPGELPGIALGGLPGGTPGPLSPVDQPEIPSPPGIPGGYNPLGAPMVPGGGRSSSGYPGMDSNRFNRSVMASTAMAISLASLGDRTFVVSEPGRGTEGQLGAWFTVYRIDGTQLKKIATGFHALRSDASDRRNVPGMMPGTPGMNPMGIPGLGGASPAPVAPSNPGGGLLGLPGGTAPAPATPALKLTTPARSAPVTIRPALKAAPTSKGK